jgi:hypothetical protein
MHGGYLSLYQKSPANEMPDSYEPRIILHPAWICISGVLLSISFSQWKAYPFPGIPRPGADSTCRLQTSRLGDSILFLEPKKSSKRNAGQL